MPDPININPIDLQPDVALGVDLPMDNAQGSALASTYYTRDQVKANFRSVLSTMIGERVMQPTFGTYLYNFLFEPITEELKHKQIYDEIKRCATLWVPQISVEAIEFPINVKEQTITVKVKYTIPQQNVEDDLTLEVT